ncbi:MAG: aldo/keto reductase family protein [Sulfobacillus sp.]
MHYRKVGSHGIRLSELTLGTWLTFTGGISEGVAIQCVHRAFDLGITSFDTANLYGSGEAERVLGKAIQGINRHDTVLTTKVFFPMGTGPNNKGLSRKHIFEQCNASLTRLGTDYIDFYLCHRPDPEVPLEETLRAMDDLVTQGKVLYYGVSQWPEPLLRDAVKYIAVTQGHPLAVNQVKYNLLQSTAEEVFAVCQQLGIGITAYSPLAQGVLTGKYLKSVPPRSRAVNALMNAFLGDLLSVENAQKVAAVTNIAGIGGVSPVQLALAWVLRRPWVCSAIIGASSPDQIEQNVREWARGCPDDILLLASQACAEGGTDVIA